MTKAIFSALYGQESGTVPATKKLTEATSAFEIKTQGKNFAHIKVGKETIDVPRALYVKTLEDQIERNERAIKKAEVAIRKLTNALNSATREINDLRKDLKNKVDRF